MFLSGIEAKKVKFGVIASLVCLVFIFSPTQAISQSQLPNPIILGIRSGVPPIASIRTEADGKDEFFGFCKVFGDELENYLHNQNEKIKVEYTKIVNSNRGPNYPRYDGLKKGRVHIQCGSNSKLPTDNPDRILFSDTFFSTGIKLLLKEGLSKKLTPLSDEELNEEYKSLKIGVVNNTTTHTQISLRKEKFPSYRLYSTRDEALDELNNDKIDAYASDAIILRSILEEGERNNPPYKTKGYDSFPKKKYLTDMPEEYAIAVYRNTLYSSELIKDINQVLKLPILEDETLKLSAYENKNNTPWNELINALLKFFDKNYKLFLFLGILVVIVLILVGIAALLPSTLRSQFLLSLSRKFNDLFEILVRAFLDRFK